MSIFVKGRRRPGGRTVEVEVSGGASPTDSVSYYAEPNPVLPDSNAGVDPLTGWFLISSDESPHLSVDPETGIFTILTAGLWAITLSGEPIAPLDTDGARITVAMASDGFPSVAPGFVIPSPSDGVFGMMYSGGHTYYYPAGQEFWVKAASSNLEDPQTIYVEIDLTLVKAK